MSFADLPNILFIEYHQENSNFEFQTTKYVGSGIKESLELLTVDTINLNDDPWKSLNNTDLFPDKISNMHGKEIVLALFNYMPYVLWTEVVSTIRRS